MKTNAGEIVEHAIRRQNINISELSRRMNVNRRTLYNWFQQKSLNADVIHGIGQVINYDFSKDFNDELAESYPKAKDPKSPQLKAEQAKGESVYYWMEKYIALLEDYKILLQQTTIESRMNRPRNKNNN